MKGRRKTGNKPNHLSLSPQSPSFSSRRTDVISNCPNIRSDVSVGTMARKMEESLGCTTSLGSSTSSLSSLLFSKVTLFPLHYPSSERPAAIQMTEPENQVPCWSFSFSHFPKLDVLSISPPEISCHLIPILTIYFGPCLFSPKDVCGFLPVLPWLGPSFHPLLCFNSTCSESPSLAALSKLWLPSLFLFTHVSFLNRLYSHLSSTHTYTPLYTDIT